MADLSIVAEEVFKILQSFNYTAHLYDENRGAVTEPADARVFMCLPNNLMVNLVDDDDNSSLTLYTGKAVHISDVMGLNQSLRTLVNKYNIIFKAQQHGKGRITPKDFAQAASITEDFGMQVCEGMYGTSRSSYLRLENARMIVRHHSQIDDKVGARGRQIASIVVEDAAGERYPLPTTDLRIGRAMALYLNQGGSVTDTVGQKIIEGECQGEVDEARKEEDIPMKKILGQPVTIAAWDAFWNENELPVSREPDLHIPGRIRDAVQILAFKLSQIANVVQDHSLSTLFSRVAEKMPDTNDPKHRKAFILIAKRALKAIGDTPDLADKNSTVIEHLDWLKSFDPDRMLTEIAWHPNDPSFDTAPYDLAEADVIDNFSPADFVHSAQMQDIIGGRDPHSPDENNLEHDEVMQALQGYIRHEISTYHPDVIGGFDDVTALAKQLYDRACDAVQEMGFVVEADGLDEGELTSEDVLLPKDDQGADLANEVTTKAVANPDDPDELEPIDHGYTNRLVTLAGMDRY